MSEFKALMRYTPPPFHLFEKYHLGEGFLSLADHAVSYAYSEFIEADAIDEDEFMAWGNDPLGTDEYDLVDLYGQWTKADDLLKRLEYMEPAERAKHLTLGPLKDRLDYEKISQKFADLTAELKAWEQEVGERLVYPALDRQLKRRLDKWEYYLDMAVKDFEAGRDLEGDEERMDGIDDYCDERTLIEYAAMGIQNLQFREPGRLKPLPYLKTFIARRLELDERFRKALNGRFCPAPWADPAFWWHWPPKSQKKQRTK